MGGESENVPSESAPVEEDSEIPMLEPPESAIEDSFACLEGEVSEICCSRRSFDNISDVEVETCQEIVQLDCGLKGGGVFEELGPPCTSSLAHCKELLTLFLPLSERNVALIIAVVARKHSGTEDASGAHATFRSVLFGNPPEQPDPAWLCTWRPDILMEAIKQLAPNLHWFSVVENLDHEGFVVPDEQAFRLLVSIYTKCCREPFPVRAVCEKVWRNSEGQLSFLKHAISASSDVFSFASSTKHVLIDTLNKYGANNPWTSLDLLEALCRLAEAGHADDVQSLLEYPKHHCPELLIIGLAQVKTEINMIQTEYCPALFKTYLNNQNASTVLRQIWEKNQEMAVRCMVESYSKETGSRILELCQDLKVLKAVLNSFPFTSAVELAALATRREYLLLEGWLNENLRERGDEFFKACLKFLQDHVNEHVEISDTFFKALKSFAGHVTSKGLVDEMLRIHSEAVSSNPRLSVSTEGLANDYEEEANEYFNQLYLGQITVDSVVEMLQEFNNSENERERKIAAFMIQSLFEEYKFLSSYPERELRTTGVLFGKLVKHQLISSIALGVALRLVLDALRKPLDSQMFLFGLTALEQFMERLAEWVQYCNHLMQIAHLRESRPTLIKFIERTLNAGAMADLKVTTPEGSEDVKPSLPAMQLPQEDRPRLSRATSQLFDATKTPPKQSTITRPARTASVPAPRHPNAPPPTTPGFGHAFNIETLVAAAERSDTVIEHPSSDVQDKVAFMFNNMALGNYEAKAKECMELLSEQYYPWFAQYLVMKRASIEPNHHALYVDVIDKMNSKPLLKEIVKASYENCKVLLRSELIKSSSEERSLLKNLGSWLGRLTIGRNQVLRAKEIDPKSLIIEAYEKGLMIAVIPFTSKILEPCRDSPVYQPPNPWTTAILSLLAEIYYLPNLKMNLKFDIEVLFKHLCVDAKDLKPTQLVKGRRREIEGNPDFSSKDIVPPTDHSPINVLQNVEFLPDIPVSHSSGNISQHLSQDDDKIIPFPPERAPVKVPSVTQPPTYNTGPIQLTTSFVVINSKLVGLNQHQTQQLHRHLPLAMERAIREIIGPVVERSVTIACMTTRDLILKDFAYETDDSHTLNSGNLMVASLAGSLAHVTCKEPLRVAMANHNRVLLQNINVPSEMMDAAVHIITNDNLDLGCALIEKSATEKALRDIEEILLSNLSTKRTMINYQQQARLPEALRPKPGRLAPVQQRVFEDFTRLPWQTHYGTSRTYPGPASSVTQAMDNADDLDARTPSPTSFSDGGSRQQDATVEPIPAEGGAGFDGKPNVEQEAESRIVAMKEPSPRDTELRDQIVSWFDEWAVVYKGSNEQIASYISKLVQSQFFKGDESTDRFFRILTEFVVAHAISTENVSPPILSYTGVDMYGKLVLSLVKYFVQDAAMSKMNLLNKVLIVTVRVIQKDASDKKAKFQPRPYFRLMAMWLMDFSLDHALDSINAQVLTSFSNALNMLQPLKVPGFSFVWLELISHRYFLPKQLIGQSQKGWPHFQRLLVALFKFMDPYLRSTELTEPVRLLYKGTLRVLLVLLHDFPEFLCEYHFSFCDVIPPSCIQMRNLILSAFPRNMRLPDPFTPNLKVDLLPEISQAPRIQSDVEAALKSKDLKGEVDEYLKTRQSLPILFNVLKQRLLLTPSEAVTSGTRYNVPLINSLVLYVGMTAIQQLQSKTTPQQLAVPTAPITHSAPMDIFQKLIGELDTEGRYLFLNAIANQLRYPNNHTHYFSCVLLYLFAEAGQEIIQEQITRVLLERLIVNRPHPWGLLITFIELIKNPRYSFWSHQFTRCAPEIERLFDSVARSCMGSAMKPTDEEQVPNAEAIKG